MPNRAPSSGRRARRLAQKALRAPVCSHRFHLRVVPQSFKNVFFPYANSRKDTRGKFESRKTPKGLESVSGPPPPTTGTRFAFRSLLVTTVRFKSDSDFLRVQTHEEHVSCGFFHNTREMSSQSLVRSPTTRSRKPNVESHIVSLVVGRSSRDASRSLSWEMGSECRPASHLHLER